MNVEQLCGVCIKFTLGGRLQECATKVHLALPTCEGKTMKAKRADLTSKTTFFLVFKCPDINIRPKMKSYCLDLSTAIVSFVSLS